MVFSKIFGRSEPAPGEPPDDEPVESDEADADPDPDSPLEPPDESHAQRAAGVIPGGASTGSKRASAMLGDGYPTHFVRAAGCHIVTADGGNFIDCTMALGSVALGYAEPELTRLVIETLANGSVSGLSPALEIDVAERFCAFVPCADRVQFLKTGADAMSAAVRIARTYTGRDMVIGCGYFGWHDWASDAAGVPASVKANRTSVPFDDIPALEAATRDAGDRLAAIVIEPVIERLPSKEWLVRARELCDAAGAALIFDEMKTGFRVAPGGYQQVVDVTPDLAAFGKALANGYPLAAVCGSAALMEAATRTWISSTLASEAGALAAASAVMHWHDRADICASLAETGREMQEAVSAAMTAAGVGGVALGGIDPMWFLRFDTPERETVFLRAAADHGVLFKRGAYNFAAMAHDDDAIRGIEAAASAGFVALREHDRQ
jgi:glutamate-1-semialdehyde 2,1-aminomutase